VGRSAERCGRSAGGVNGSTGWGAYDEEQEEAGATSTRRGRGAYAGSSALLGVATATAMFGAGLSSERATGRRPCVICSDLPYLGTHLRSNRGRTAFRSALVH
jgi:hypothetical protein